MACPGQEPVEPVPRSDVEVVRLRPGMFVGDTGAAGMHALLFGLVTSSLAEIAAGRGRSVRVSLRADNSAEVEDDAPPYPRDGEAIEFTFSRWPGHSSPPGERDRLAQLCANALSERLSFTARTDGSTYHHSFRAGEMHAAVQMGGPPKACGLTIAFRPDPEIFGTAQFDAAEIRDRLRQLAFLHSGVRITFADETTGTRDEFEFADGIRECVKFLNASRRSLHDALILRGEEQGVRYEVGLQWCAEAEEVRRSFANHYCTSQGGTHERGALAGAAMGLLDFIREHAPQSGELTPDDRRAGLTAVVSVWLREPYFEGATRSRLNNPEVEGIVKAAVRRGVFEYFEANREAADRVVKAAVAERKKR